VSRGLAGVALATACLLAPLGAAAAQIELGPAWMRPAAAGSEANAYVDIVSDAALTLVRASSPPVTLQFRDRAGKRHHAVAQVQVRGLLLPGG
jgi:hypothetical protein